MSHHPQGTKGTFWLTLAAIGQGLSVVAFLVQATLLLIVGPMAVGRMDETRIRMMNLSAEGLSGYGLRYIYVFAFVILFASLVVAIFMLIMCVVYRKRSGQGLFISITSLIFLVISLLIFFMTNHWFQLFQAAVWLLSFIGGLLSKRPRKPLALSPRTEALAKAVEYDSGIRRPNS